MRRPEPGRSIFVAVPLPDGARDAIAELVERVKAGVARDVGTDARPVRWVRTDGLHITVRFFGLVAEDHLDHLADSIAAAAASSPQMRIRIHGGGGFPRPERPRTLWLRIDDGAAALAAIATELDGRLAATGWSQETRPFRAHLTLARADGVRAGPDTLRHLVDEAQRLAFEFVADELVLFESVTGGGAARYEPLLRMPLTGEG